MKCFIRVAKELDFDEVAKHLLVVGDLKGDCFTCRQIGIDYGREKYCPGCKTDFKYVTYRKPADAPMIGRLMRKRPDLVYVEFSDVKEVSDTRKARDFFK